MDGEIKSFAFWLSSLFTTWSSATPAVLLTQRQTACPSLLNVTPRYLLGKVVHAITRIKIQRETQKKCDFMAEKGQEIV